MLTLRWSSASRVRASGSRTGRSLTASIGAVTSRMITSTSATSMIGVTLTRVMMSEGVATKRLMLPPDYRDVRGPVGLGLVDHADEGAVRDLVGAAHHHVVRRALGEQRTQDGAERRARNC